MANSALYIRLDPARYERLRRWAVDQRRTMNDQAVWALEQLIDELPPETRAGEPRTSAPPTAVLA